MYATPVAGGSSRGENRAQARRRRASTFLGGGHVAYLIRDLDANSERELDTVTRMCMTTVLDTIPEFEHDE